MSAPQQATAPALSQVEAEQQGARQYGDVAAVYDTLMAGVPHSLWLTRIEHAAAERGKPCGTGSALDVACGTGLVTEILHQRGYGPVVGVDLSEAMVRIARTKALGKHLPLTYLAQDAAALDLPERSFELIVSLFDSLNYITDPKHLQAAFHRIYRHTAPGGIFAFDLNSLYALANSLFDQTGTYGPVHHVWKPYWDRATRLCRIEMSFWVRDETTGQTRHFTETHIQRAYTVSEITEWLTAAGFLHISVFGGYGHRPPTPKSDRLLFIAEKE